MSNYSVPFDYDGSKLVWIEFLSPTDRTICVQHFEENKKWSTKLDKNFGHVSFVRLLPNNMIFLVKELVVCQIRSLDDKFTLIEEFKNSGDEVIACDVVFKDKTHTIEEGIDKVEKNFVKLDVNEKKQKSMMEDSGMNQGKDLQMFLLDCEGEVTCYSKGRLIKLFDLYKVKEIDKDCKDKHFFSMGYPYYMKAFDNVVAVTTDHGVFVLKNN